MAEIPRLNGMIKCFEEGKPAMGAFCTPDVDAALAASQAKYDSIIFEMEHNIWDIRALRDCLQYMLNRKQIADKGSVAPNVTFTRSRPAARNRSQPRSFSTRPEYSTPSRRSRAAATSSAPAI